MVHLPSPYFSHSSILFWALSISSIFVTRTVDEKDFFYVDKKLFQSASSEATVKRKFLKMSAKSRSIGAGKSNTLFESEESILRDIYSISECFRQDNTLHLRRISDLRRARAEEEQNMKEIFQMGIDLWHDRKFGHLKAESTTSKVIKQTIKYSFEDDKRNKKDKRNNNIRNEKSTNSDNTTSSNTGQPSHENKAYSIPPPFLPPIHRQSQLQLKKVDYGEENESMLLTRPLTMRDICNTRYLRLPKNYIPKC